MTTLIDVTTITGTKVTINANKIVSMYRNEGNGTTIWFDGEGKGDDYIEPIEKIKRAIWDMESEFHDIGTHLDSIGSTLHDIHQHMIGEEL
jgi:hypothetical protein